MLYIKVNDVTRVVCADIGAAHYIAGQMLYKLLCDQGILFEGTDISITLADGLRRETNVLQTIITVEIEGRITNTTIFALPEAEGNRTLLGIDLFNKMGIVLYMRSRSWYF